MVFMSRCRRKQGWSLYLPIKEPGWKVPSEIFVVIGENSHDVVTQRDM